MTTPLETNLAAATAHSAAAHVPAVQSPALVAYLAQPEHFDRDSTDFLSDVTATPVGTLIHQSADPLSPLNPADYFRSLIKQLLGLCDCTNRRCQVSTHVLGGLTIMIATLTKELNVPTDNFWDVFEIIKMDKLPFCTRNACATARDDLSQTAIELNNLQEKCRAEEALEKQNLQALTTENKALKENIKGIEISRSKERLLVQQGKQAEEVEGILKRNLQIGTAKNKELVDQVSRLQQEIAASGTNNVLQQQNHTLRSRNQYLENLLRNGVITAPVETDPWVLFTVDVKRTLRDIKSDAKQLVHEADEASRGNKNDGFDKLSKATRRFKKSVDSKVDKAINKLP